nr:fumarate hydratase [Pseudomonas monteilii]
MFTALHAGARFPLLGEMEGILENATKEATIQGPLRHNAVGTFIEQNTGTNTGSKIPWLDWEIIPDADHCIVDVYMAGGGRTLACRSPLSEPCA